MTPATVERLLHLNREFYRTVATNFDETRGGLPIGWRQLHQWLPKRTRQPLRVLDVGCGNGRFAWLLDEWGIAADYIGVDGDGQLLTLATEHARTLRTVRTNFVQADFTAATWCADANLPAASFDLVVCFAALHHVPGWALRQQVVGALAGLLTADGTLILSHWQFLSSARFVRKQIAWQTIGLTERDVETGDALLPWHQGTYAVRYVHQTDAAEAQQLAASAKLELVEQFYADGKEGNLNLYTILRACEGKDEHDR
jgi:2-polyprenyl-3-methyl-5-hydroxy-6-metoxy-1,4-benzoquinol methylase